MGRDGTKHPMCKRGRTTNGWIDGWTDGWIDGRSRSTSSFSVSVGVRVGFSSIVTCCGLKGCVGAV